MHQPEPQVVGGSRPDANENSGKDRSDRGRVTIGILVEFDQQTDLARAQGFGLQPAAQVRIRYDLWSVVEVTARNGAANARKPNFAHPHARVADRIEARSQTKLLFPGLI